MKKINVLYQDIDLHVAINIPINMYKSMSLKESFKVFIENDSKPIFFKLNDRPFIFNLNDVTICFEGMGLTYSNPTEHSKFSSTVVDIGGLNTTYCTFNGVQPDFNSMTVSHLGMNTLKSNLEQEFVQTYNSNISSNDLEQFIQRGYFTHLGVNDESSRNVISHLKENHFHQIINFAKQHNYTFNQDKIYFTGGGSLLLQKQIEVEFPQAIIVINPQFANVKSFLEIIKVKYA